MKDRVLKVSTALGCGGLWALFLRVSGPACPPVIGCLLLGGCVLASLFWLDEYGNDFMKGVFGDEN